MATTDLMTAIQNSSPSEKSQALAVLLREMIASRSENGPILVREQSSNGNVAYVLPIVSEDHRAVVEREAVFLAELQNRIDNPPDRFLSAEEFLAGLEESR